MVWFDLDGHPYPGDLNEQAAAFERDFLLPGNRLRSRPFFQGGMGLFVSTVPIGLDKAWGYGPPLIWETMVRTDRWQDWQWRYSTRAAALNGHRQVIAAIHGMQRGRREHRLIFR